MLRHKTPKHATYLIYFFIFDSFKHASGEFVWEWILGVWDNFGGNIKLNQYKLVDTAH